MSKKKPSTHNGFSTLLRALWISRFWQIGDLNLLWASMLPTMMETYLAFSVSQPLMSWLSLATRFRKVRSSKKDHWLRSHSSSPLWLYKVPKVSSWLIQPSKKCISRTISSQSHSCLAAGSSTLRSLFASAQLSPHPNFNPLSRSFPPWVS